MRVLENCIVRFGGEDCNVVIDTYPDTKKTKISLTTLEGEPMATASVNDPDIVMNEGQTLIKDFSENTGILAALIKAGLVDKTGRIVQSGYEMLHVVNTLFDQTEDAKVG